MVSAERSAGCLANGLIIKPSPAVFRKASQGGQTIYSITYMNPSEHVYPWNYGFFEKCTEGLGNVGNLGVVAGRFTRGADSRVVAGPPISRRTVPYTWRMEA